MLFGSPLIFQSNFAMTSHTFILFTEEKMCKVIEKFAVKIFFGRTYIITGHDPEIYHLFICVLLYVFQIAVFYRRGRENRPLQFIWVIFITVKCAFSIAERAVPKQHP